VKIDGKNPKEIGSENLKGLSEAINAVFPQTKQQHCIVRQIRNSVKFVPCKNRKIEYLTTLSSYKLRQAQRCTPALLFLCRSNSIVINLDYYSIYTKEFSEP